MPAQSKIKATKPRGDPKTPVERDRFFCCRCDRVFKKQKSNFPASQSQLFIGNSGYLPLCRHCLDELYRHYKEILGETESIKRICMKFDIYWNKEIYEMLNKTSTTHSRVLAYISKTNLIQHAGKTYDDTLDEEKEKTVSISMVEQLCQDDESEFDMDSIRFWGTGFLPEEYEDLNSRYTSWSSGYECKTVAEASLLKQIVLTEWRITKETQKGAKTEGLINAFNALLGSANLKPVQNKENTLADQDHTMGTLIKMWETEKPIPEPAEEWKDVDGIVKYISIWFLGHLCKMMKIKNSYSRLYEQEMAKYRVDKPEYESEDDELLFDEIFGGNEHDI